MLNLSRPWFIVVCMTALFKIALILSTPAYGYDVSDFAFARWGDFFNWISGGKEVLISLENGHVASIVPSGAYLGMVVLIAPLFWFWTVLPVQHPALSQIYANPSISYSFLLVMKFPIFILDFATGILIMKISKLNSTSLGSKGFLAWYLNPLNCFWLYRYSTYDIIPTAIVTLAVFLGLRKRWFWSGLCLSFATLLRLYPILIIPFFLLYAKRDSRSAFGTMLFAFVAPLLSVFSGLLVAVGSISSMISIISNISGLLQPPYQLLLFYGFSVSDSSITLTPFLLAIQLYFLGFWFDRSSSLMEATLVALLLVFAVSYHAGFHFLWASPFLSIYLDRFNKSLLYGLTYLFVFFSPHYAGGALLFPVAGQLYNNSLTVFCMMLVAGASVGCKITYVLLVNAREIGIRAKFVSIARIGGTRKSFRKI